MLARVRSSGRFRCCPAYRVMTGTTSCGGTRWTNKRGAVASRQARIPVLSDRVMPFQTPRRTGMSFGQVGILQGFGVSHGMVYSQDTAR
jgi:hypothetical protein